MCTEVGLRQDCLCREPLVGQNPSCSFCELVRAVGDETVCVDSMRGRDAASRAVGNEVVLMGSLGTRPC